MVIRSNLLEDIGGDGIKVWGSDGALVEHNTVRGGRTRCDDYAAGLWPFDSDDTVIQFNEVSGVKGIKDGQAFDADYRCRRSLFQYNYSHDNEGGFMLVCTPGTYTVFAHNVFFGRHAGRPPDSFGSTNQPPLLGPGRGGAGFASLEGYRLRTVPAFMRGARLPEHGGRDLLGNSVPAHAAPCVGAMEGPP